MRFDSASEALLKKWWFFGPTLFAALFTKPWLFVAAAYPRAPTSIFSFEGLVHLSATFALWYWYAQLGSMVVLRIWPEHLDPLPRKEGKDIHG